MVLDLLAWLGITNPAFIPNAITGLFGFAGVSRRSDGFRRFQGAAVNGVSLARPFRLALGDEGVDAFLGIARQHILHHHFRRVRIGV